MDHGQPMSSESFYAMLPVFADFIEISQPANYADLPGDWQVAVADVQGSTEAIEAGRYKEVNMLGASCIMGVLNVVRPVEIPYIFGGDGASLCVPPSVVEPARRALLATQMMARDEFKLALRVGMVPVHVIEDAGFKVRVGKYRASANYVQAAFSGGGVQYAESLVKDADAGQRWQLRADHGAGRGDYTGLECRWDSISSPRGEFVTLLVQAAGRDESSAAVYREVIATIQRIYGEGASTVPVREQSLSLTLDPRKIQPEARIRAAGRGRLSQWLYVRWVQWQSMCGRVLLNKGWKAGGVDWGRYRHDVIANTDYRKFDDVLRHVLSGAEGQREELSAWLEARYQRGELAYGLHWAPTALMTCLIFQREGGHVHFVDGADGGYTMAARDLKQRLKNRAA
jgi:hypothetical protein